MEFAIRDFMEINQKMVIEETDKWHKYNNHKRNRMPAREKNRGSDDGSDGVRSVDAKEHPQIRKSKVAQLHNLPITWSEHVEEEPKSRDNDWDFGQVNHCS